MSPPTFLRSSVPDTGTERRKNGTGLGALAAVECPVTGRRLRLRRAWPRDAGHLLLEYLDGDAGGAGATVAGQWFADGAHLEAVAGQTAAVAPAGAVATVDGAGIVLQWGGADRRLPGLARVLDGPGTTLVVHRPERRAVVRREAPAATTYLKMVRPGRLPAVVGSVEGLGTPAVVDHDPATGTIEHAALPGTSLHEMLDDPAFPEADVVAAFAATGAAVRRLHGAVPPVAARSHDAAAEAGVAARWAEHALVHRVLAPVEAERVRAQAAEVASLLRRHPAPGPGALIHRDLHDKQVLVTATGDVGILDLDTLARGDAALDVANLVVHLELRALQGHCGPGLARAAADAFFDGYRPDRGLRERLAAYAAASRLRLACVYAFRPRWSRLGGRLLGPV